MARVGDYVYGPQTMEFNASLYVQIGRPDLAVPLSTKALANHGIGENNSPMPLE